MCGIAYKWGGRAGGMVGVWVRMHVYLHRSGKMDVNHITYILVYTEHGSENSGNSRTIFLFLLLGVDTSREMCKTIYN